MNFVHSFPLSYPHNIASNVFIHMSVLKKNTVKKIVIGLEKLMKGSFLQNIVVKT